MIAKKVKSQCIALTLRVVSLSYFFHVWICKTEVTYHCNWPIEWPFWSKRCKWVWGQSQRQRAWNLGPDLNQLESFRYSASTVLLTATTHLPLDRINETCEPLVSSSESDNVSAKGARKVSVPLPPLLLSPKGLRLKNILIKITFDKLFWLFLETQNTRLIGGGKIDFLYGQKLFLYRDWS